MIEDENKTPEKVMVAGGTQVNATQSIATAQRFSGNLSRPSTNGKAWRSVERGSAERKLVAPAQGGVSLNMRRIKVVDVITPGAESRNLDQTNQGQ